MWAHGDGDYSNVEVLLVCPKCGSQNIMYQHKTENMLTQIGDFTIDEEYFICLDCGETFQQPQEKEIVCKLGFCEFCGKYTTLVIHHMNMDRSDNRPINIARICKYCHGMYHGLLNQLIPDKASHIEVIYMLQEIGLNKKEILEALKDSAIKINQLKGIDNPKLEVKKDKTKLSVSIIKIPATNKRT